MSSCSFLSISLYFFLVHSVLNFLLILRLKISLKKYTLIHFKRVWHDHISDRFLTVMMQVVTIWYSVVGFLFCFFLFQSNVVSYIFFWSFQWFLLVSIVLVVLVCILFCSRMTSVEAAPICTNSQAGCHVITLANLFDRVIQHSAKIQSFTNYLHSEFVSLNLF